jgi:tRNA (guanine37-N1)-methyltransferase
MHFHIVTIFPEIFESFSKTSIISKAQEKKLLNFSYYNPRSFTNDKHQQIDDTPYGGGTGMLLKAQPLVDTTRHIIEKYQLKHNNRTILYPSPSKENFTQKQAHVLAKHEHIIIICGRYEGIDYRFEQYIIDHYPNHFRKLSLGSFITLWGETPSMVMIESIARLIPGVIKESDSRIHESYSITSNSKNLEAPHYTKPAEVYGYQVPDILLSGDNKAIQKRQEDHSQYI